ncbi:MAG TPA: hypothetical protein DD473_07880 [Planctomycetaceae bacterium]|nr:hypothetical protein [Planctomycetaceae bacterium]
MKTIAKCYSTHWVSGFLLLGLLILGVPMMLCMPLTADPSLYDLQAQTVLEGGVLYRDIVEPNLPGIVWAHIAIRSLFGWSGYALKAVDLVIVGSIVFLLSIWFRNRESSLKTSISERLFLSVMLIWFYFGTSEWCHCQRDTWMFLPALLGLYLRRRQIERIELKQATNSQIHFWGVLEGIVWAIGFWIKPFIAIPALAAMIVGWLRKPDGRKCGVDFAGVLFGGLFIGGIGTSWLVMSGTWPHFWEMAIEWNPTYFEVGRERWTWDRLWRQQLRFYPFSLAHLIAIPAAVLSLIRTSARNRDLSQTLLSAVYLGWLFQTFFFQHLFDYIHVPELMLAILLSMRAVSQGIHQLECKAESQNQTVFFRPVIATCCVLVALAFSPATRWQRVQHWSQCFREGSSPDVKTGLQHFPLPNWNELEPALEFLRQQKLRDGELTVHNVYLVHAYRELELKPSTRFVYLDVLTRVFRDHQNEIVERLDRSGHKYILSSLLENGLTLEQCQTPAKEYTHQLPPDFPQEHLDEFPYQHPVVFRSGQYVIHKVIGTAAPLNPEFSPLAANVN